MTLPVYEHHLTVGEAAVTPRGPLFCGTAGDKHAAKLIFSPLEAGYHYRLEIVNGAGEYDITERLTVANGEASVTVPAAWTAAGTAAVRLLQFEEQDGTESARCYYPPVLLSFAYRDEGGAPAVAEPLWQEQVTRAEALLDELTVTAADAQRAIEAAEQSMNAAKQAVSAATLAAELAAEAIEKADAPKPAAAVTVERGDENFIPLGDNVQTALGNLSTALLRYDNEVHERMDDMGDALADVGLGVHDLEIKHDRYERDARQLFAGALKGTASGEVVSITDVSPVEHIVKTSVAIGSTPYIEDIANVKVLAMGKNWFNSSFTIGGLVGVNGTNWDDTDLQVRTDFIAVKPKQTYILSSGDYKLRKIHCFDSNKKWLGQIGQIREQQLVTPADTVYIRFTCQKSDETAFTAEDIEKINALPIQLELGTAATEYAPYKEPVEVGATFTSYQDMVITTDTVGALVNVEYNRDINKAFEMMTQAIISLGGNV